VEAIKDFVAWAAVVTVVFVLLFVTKKLLSKDTSAKGRRQGDV